MLFKIMNRIGISPVRTVRGAFMQKLKDDQTKHRTYETTLLLIEDSLYYVYGYYNTKYIHQLSGYITSLEFRNSYFIVHYT